MDAQVSVKVYYVENKTTKEIRRFAVDESVAGNFDYLLEKIRQVFPDLTRKQLNVFWKDEEEDYISISSDEELHQALGSISMKTECLKIFVQAKDQKLVEHPGVICDGCDSNIFGVRYKCTVCDDFDLCSSCKESGVHADHETIIIEAPHEANEFIIFDFGGRTGGKCRRGGPFSRRGMGCGPFGPRTGPGCHKGGSFGPRGFGGPCGPRGFGPRGGCGGFGPQGSGGPRGFGPRGEFGGFGPRGRGGHCHRGGPFGPRGFGPFGPRGSEPFTTTPPFFEMGYFECNDQPKEAEKPQPTDNVPKSQSTNDNQEKSDVSEVHEPTTGCNQSPLPENFIYVDETLVPEPVTVANSYDQQLEKAIKQMEAMGFDNDSGWLKQLLVSKDLNIGKVLDAMNPSMQS